MCPGAEVHDLLSRSLWVFVIAAASTASLDWLGQGLCPPALALACAYLFGWLAALLVLPALWLLGRLPWYAQRMACVTVGALLGLWAAQQAGAFAKLNGRHGTMALALAVGMPLFGSLLAVWVDLLVAVNLRVLGRARRRLAQIAGLATLLAGMGCLVLGELVTVLRSYPSLLAALFVAELALFAAPVAMTLKSLVLSQNARRLIMAGMALLLVPVLLWTCGVSESEVSRILHSRSTIQQVTLLRWFTDLDRDGHSSLFGGGDCAPLDSSVHPGHVEVPGNGRDDNCRYGDAVPRALPVMPAISSDSPVPVNVLLITVDALRADHTSAYGYSRATTPRLKGLVAGASLFTRAYANGAWTGLSIPSLFTSALPRDIVWKRFAVTETGRLVPFPTPPDAAEGERILALTPIPERLPWPTLPAWLSRRGLRTIGIVPHEILDGMRRTFDGQLEVLRSGGSTDGSITDTALSTLSEAEPSRAWFLWVHYYGVHPPVRWSPQTPDFGPSALDAYDRAVAGVDLEIGRLVAFIDARTERPTAIIVTADHGEELEAGRGFHGLDLRESCLHVPLIVRGPGFAPGVRDSLVSLVDIMPTILQWTGTPGPSAAEGHSLGDVPGDRATVADLWRYDFSGTVVFDSVRVRTKQQRIENDLLLGRRIHAILDLDPWSSGKESEASALPNAADLETTLGRYLERAVGGP